MYLSSSCTLISQITIPLPMFISLPLMVLYDSFTTLFVSPSVKAVDTLCKEMCEKKTFQSEANRPLANWSRGVEGTNLKKNRGKGVGAEAGRGGWSWGWERGLQLGLGGGFGAGAGRGDWS